MKIENQVVELSHPGLENVVAVAEAEHPKMLWAMQVHHFSFNHRTSSVELDEAAVFVCAITAGDDVTHLQIEIGHGQILGLSARGGAVQNNERLPVPMKIGQVVGFVFNVGHRSRIEGG